MVEEINSSNSEVVINKQKYDTKFAELENNFKLLSKENLSNVVIIDKLKVDIENDNIIKNESKNTIQNLNEKIEQLTLFTDKIAKDFEFTKNDLEFTLNLNEKLIVENKILREKFSETGNDKN